jgi:hypothetical protein
VTEVEWLARTDPETLLEHLKGKASERKLRLFACACVRRVGHLLGARSHNAVDVLERFVDGSASGTGMAIAINLHQRAVQDAWRNAARIGAGVVNQLMTGAAWPLAWNAVSEVRRAIREDSPQADTYGESTSQVALLRDIFGNPFHPSPSLPPAVLAWNDGTVRRLAQAAYDERQLPAGTLDAGRLGVLADALLDAGCGDDEVVRHLREPGPHVRGCWAVDIILGRE